MSRFERLGSTVLTRRSFTQGLALAGFGAVVAPVGLAQAAPGGFGEQAEWVQRYDDGGASAPVRATTPLLSAQTVTATEQAIGQYQDLATRGGWRPVPAGQTLKVGSRGPAVTALRQRLTITGDLDNAAGTSPVFDSYVEAGVKRFQARHGIGPSGIAGSETIAAMNVPIDTRIKQLETNLVRLRAFAGNLGGRFVTLNIPAAAVETVENGTVITHHIAGVGKIDRQSPVMQTKALDINFNPYWTVPASIIRKDLIPKMQADSKYLSDNKIRVFDSAHQEVPPQSINWNSMEATHYTFRQDPGADINSLGVVRVNIANPYGVYMHDTPAKGVFGDDYRFVSSGCVRVQNIRDYVAWLLKDNPGWDRDKIDQTIASGEQVNVKIPPVPVYWVYITAWSTDGLIQFRDDIYHRDGFGVGTVASITAAQQNSSGAGTAALLDPNGD